MIGPPRFCGISMRRPICLALMAFLAPVSAVRASAQGAATSPGFAVTAVPNTITEKQGTVGWSAIQIVSTTYSGSLQFTMTSNNAAVLNDGCYVIQGLYVSPGSESATLAVYSAQRECEQNPYGNAGYASGLGSGSSGGSPQPGAPLAPSALAGAAVLALFSFRRSRSKAGNLLGLVVLILSVAGLISGCGSGPVSPVVPKGTYLLTLTGTDSQNPNLTASTNITLVVN